MISFCCFILSWVLIIRIHFSFDRGFLTRILGILLVFPLIIIILFILVLLIFVIVFLVGIWKVFFRRCFLLRPRCQFVFLFLLLFYCFCQIGKRIFLRFLPYPIPISSTLLHFSSIPLLLINLIIIILLLLIVNPHLHHPIHHHPHYHYPFLNYYYYRKSYLPRYCYLYFVFFRGNPIDFLDFLNFLLLLLDFDLSCCLGLKFRRMGPFFVLVRLFAGKRHRRDLIVFFRYFLVVWVVFRPIFSVFWVIYLSYCLLSCLIGLRDHFLDLNLLLFCSKEQKRKGNYIYLLLIEFNFYIFTKNHIFFLGNLVCNW